MTHGSRWTFALAAITATLFSVSSALGQIDGEKLYANLSTQLNNPDLATTAPKGYRFSGLARGVVSAAERKLGVTDKIHVAVLASGQNAAQREGFSFHVLASPQAAKKYFELFAPEAFASSPLLPRDRQSFDVSQADFGPAGLKGQPKLSCNVLTGLLICRFYDPAIPVVIYVGGVDQADGGTSPDQQSARLKAFAKGKGTDFLDAARYHLAGALPPQTSAPRPCGPPGCSNDSRKAFQAEQCEQDRQQVVAFLNSQQKELDTIPVDAQGNPATPAARIRMCAHVTRSVAEYGKGLDQLNRCGGTDKEKANVAQLIDKLKSVVGQLGCLSGRQ